MATTAASRRLAIENQPLVPVRRVSPDTDIDSAIVAEMAEQQVTVDTVSVGFTQRDQIVRIKLKVRSEVERHDVMSHECS